MSDTPSDRANVVTLNPREGRPDPPPTLTEDQAQQWRVLVNCMPRNWMRPEFFGTLVLYVRALDRADVIATAIREHQARGLNTVEAIDRFIELAKVEGRHALLMLSCATKLRLTPRSRHYDSNRGAN